MALRITSSLRMQAVSAGLACLLLARSRRQNPLHVAVTLMAPLIFLLSVVLTKGFGLAILDAFNDAGTFGARGFLGAYFLISIAAQAYLQHRGQTGRSELAIAVISVILLLVPAVGSAVLAGECVPIHSPRLFGQRPDLVPDSPAAP
jgi:hypothetical protein